MFNLKFVEGAVPGKKNKRKASKEEKSKEYEANRKQRKLNTKWQEGRPWLVFKEEDDTMVCKVCIDFYKTGDKLSEPNLRGQNTFITGCANRKVSAVVDHESSNAHKKASQACQASANKTGGADLGSTEAGRALLSLKTAEKGRLQYLFRNVHAVIQNNKPMSDFVWLCSLDKMKGLDIGETYLNEKAALRFAKAIASTERDRIIKLLTNDASFFSFMMDGSTDISGDEQESVYIRTSVKGQVKEHFLGIGSPRTTCAKDLHEFILEMFDSNNIQKEKLVAMGSDGAANMVGCKGGLSTLLKQSVNKEMVNVHCFAHRLELAFRDVLKKNKLYDRLMTLLIGLYYFYMKIHKNKRGLLESIKALGIDGILPTKVTGIRWLPHLSRSIDAMLRTFKAYEAHLCSLSHGNTKAEGLVKIMLSKDLMCFVLFLQDVLNPLMRLSLKLQKPHSTMADCLNWVEAVKDLLEECKSRDSTRLSETLQSGSFEGIDLHGNTPSMSYKDNIIDGFIKALNHRFYFNSNEVSAISATKVLHFQNWPSYDSVEMQDFGVSEVMCVADHFKNTLKQANTNFDVGDLDQEFKMFKKILCKRYGSELQSLSWADVYDQDFPMLMLIVNLLSCIPPTSVTCETTFSQMKLIKTSRRTSMNSSTLNDLLMIKLESKKIEEFVPDTSVEKWLSLSVKDRYLSYQRKASDKAATATEPVVIIDPEIPQQSSSTSGSNITDTAPDSASECDSVSSHLDEVDMDLEAIAQVHDVCAKDDNDMFYDGFRHEEENWSFVFNI